MSNGYTYDDSEDVAVIGMSGRFPGAEDVDSLWRNLCSGTESICHFKDKELHPEQLVIKNNNSNYIKARGILEGVEYFDASFFNISPREAQLTDPQNRIFMELSWNALENAGYSPESYSGKIGLYAGKCYNAYFSNNLSSKKNLIDSYGEFETQLLNEKDFFTTQISYRLNLTGPSVNINTGCSTSLVAVCFAYESLLSYQCDLALAGGITVYVPQNSGYIYQEGKIASADGHTRPFDYDSSGTVFGNGGAAVVLKRLSDAVKDNDYVYAVIKSCGINNDGSDKLSFTAPSVNGQVDAILQAQSNADINPETIAFVEAHGTGTKLGDPIEIEALSQAFRTQSNKKQYCSIGSVKSNIGHLDSAAGIAGFIKSVLALHYRQLPPSINFRKPNPNINFEESPFHICEKLTELETKASPLRAGVSSFGVGGTNAHVILEEGPFHKQSNDSRIWQLIMLSAKTETALENRTDQLAAFFEKEEQISLADISYTLQCGRQEMDLKRYFVCRDSKEAADILKSRDSAKMVTKRDRGLEPNITFMFSGQGSQHINMAHELYEHEATFKYYIDKCADVLNPLVDADIREIIYPEKNNDQKAVDLLNQTRLTQPALFVIEYSLAKLWMEWGVTPNSMIGHSIGEYVAACLAGVFKLEDALNIVSKRAMLMQQMPEGSMCAVGLPAEKVNRCLSEDLSIASYNAPELNIVAGSNDQIALFIKRLRKHKIVTKLLHTSHAFHSKMMEPVLDPFKEFIQGIQLNPPGIPFVSNITGSWISEKEAIDPEYWVKHLCSPVMFSKGIQTLDHIPNNILIEVGPGTSLSSLAKQHGLTNGSDSVISSLSHVKVQSTALSNMLSALGRVWISGIKINWSGFYKNESRKRTPLPGYPFDKKYCWVDTVQDKKVNENVASSCQKEEITKKELNKAEPLELKKEEIVSKLALVWQDLLGIDNVSGQDNFFNIGGDSLMALRLQAKIEDTFGRVLVADDFISSPTFEGMVDLLSDGKQSEKIPSDADSSYAIVTYPAGECRKQVLGLWAKNYPNLSVDRFDWLYQGNPDGQAVCLLVKHTAIDQVVGVQGLFPRTFYVMGKKSVGLLGGDLAIDEEYRILAPAILLHKKIMAQCGDGRFSFFYGFPNDKAQAVNNMMGLMMFDVLRMVKPLKFDGYIDKRIHLKAFSKVFSNILDSVGKALSKETRYKRSGQFKVEMLSDFDTRFDQLWQSLLDKFTFIGERSSNYLKWRYLHSPHHHHEIFVLTRKSCGTLMGYIIFHVQDNFVFIDDMLCRDMNEGFEAMLSEFFLLQRQKDTISVSINFSGSDTLINKLESFGFSIRDRNQKVTVFIPDESQHKNFSLEKDNFYWMPGDKDI